MEGRKTEGDKVQNCQAAMPWAFKNWKREVCWSRSLANSSVFTHQVQNSILSAEGGNNRKSAGPFSQEDKYMGINFCHLPSTFLHYWQFSFSLWATEKQSHTQMALILHILKSFQEKCSASKWKYPSMTLIRYFATVLFHLGRRKKIKKRRYFVQPPSSSIQESKQTNIFVEEENSPGVSNQKEFCSVCQVILQMG